MTASSAIAAWWEVVWAQAIQIGVLFAVFWILDALLRRLGATRCRAALASAFLLKLALPPGLTSPISIAHLVDAPIEGALPAPASGLPAVVALALYLAGAFLAALLAVRGGRSEHKAWRVEALPAAPREVAALAGMLARRLGLRRTPDILVATGAGPAAVGCLRPVVVLPASLLAAGSRARLEHVLLHELAHVKRRDGLAQAAWMLATCVYWFHPCVWLTARRAAVLREMGSDELAARAAEGGSDGYRRTLLEMARPLAGRAAWAAGFTGGAIVTRLSALEHPLGLHPRLSNFAACTLFACAALCCVPLGRSVAEHTPAFSELEGCLRKRYFVLAEIAKEDAANSVANPR